MIEHATTSDRGLDAPAISDNPTKSPVQSRARGSRLGALAVLDQCLYSGTNFVTAVLIGRYAGASELGAYTLAFSIVVLMLSMQRSLLVAPYVVLRGKLDDIERTEMRSSIVWLALAMTLVSALVCLIAGGLVSRSIVWALGIAMGGGLLRDFVRRLAICDYQYSRVIAVDAAVAAGQLGGLVAIAVGGVFDWTLTATVALTWCGIVWTIVAVGFWMGVGSGNRQDSRRPVGLKLATANRNFRLLWPTGRWIGLTQVISTLQAFAMPWVLAVAHSIELAGVYAACWTMVQVVSPAIEAGCNLLEPSLASAASQPTMKSFHRLMRLVTVLFSVLMAVLVLAAIGLGDWLLALAYGESFASHQAVLVLLTVAAAIGNVSIPANKALIQLGWALANSIIAGVALVLTVAASLACLRWIGPEGAAWGLVIGASFGFVARWWVLRKAVADV